MKSLSLASFKKVAYNDILAKGFDSVAQECYLWINNPELASEVFGRHGHAHDWDRLKRNKGGRYDHIAKITTERLIRFADDLDKKKKSTAANKVDNLIQYMISQIRS